MKHPALAILVLLLAASYGYGDSIFDVSGTGRDVIQVAGPSRALGGAVAASTDPGSCAPMHPFASALARKVTVTIGFAHTGTKTTSLGEEQRTVGTIFPTVAVIVPLKRFSLMTGLFLEKQGRLSLAQSDTAYGSDIFDLSLRRETSLRSVPFFVSLAPHRRIMFSGGILFSALDTREETITDFRTDDRSDADDVSDLSASGQGFAGGFLLDLDLLRIAGLLRSGTDLDGTLERKNEHAGIWAAKDIRVRSEDSYRIGMRVSPVPQIALEVDFEKSPWSGLELDGEAIANHAVERWAAGLEYRGNILWQASKYPLYAGYYRQPIDWETSLTGDIVEEVYSLGTSIPMGKDRAVLSVSVEMGKREAKGPGELEEAIYGFTLSLSAMETWRREISR